MAQLAEPSQEGTSSATPLSKVGRGLAQAQAGLRERGMEWTNPAADMSPTRWNVIGSTMEECGSAREEF